MTINLRNLNLIVYIPAIKKPNISLWVSFFISFFSTPCDSNLKSYIFIWFFKTVNPVMIHNKRYIVFVISKFVKLNDSELILKRTIGICFVIHNNVIEISLHCGYASIQGRTSLTRGVAHHQFCVNFKTILPTRSRIFNFHFQTFTHLFQIEAELIFNLFFLSIKKSALRPLTWCPLPLKLDWGFFPRQKQMWKAQQKVIFS